MYSSSSSIRLANPFHQKNQFKKKNLSTFWFSQLGLHNTLTASLQRAKSPSTSNLNMTLNILTARLQNTGALRHVEYAFIAIALRFILSRNGST